MVSYQERTNDASSGKLSDPELEGLREWVKLGAPWPATATETPICVSVEEEGLTRGPEGVLVLPSASAKSLRRPFERISGFARRSTDSSLRGSNRPSSTPAPPADKRMLIRRATFDLTGLPPTEEEIRAFLADDSPDAFAKVVDRLLASPAYGERWGTALARRRPLRRLDRTPMKIIGIRTPGAIAITSSTRSTGHAVRPVHPRADRRRPAAAARRRRGQHATASSPPASWRSARSSSPSRTR